MEIAGLIHTLISMRAKIDALGLHQSGLPAPGADE